MKRKLTLLLAVLMLLSLFAGCGGANAPAPATTATADGSKASTTAPTEAPTEAPAEPDSPYHFAKGNFLADDKGIALEKYDYELPLSTTDEVLSYWMTCYVSQYLPEGGFGDCPLPTEVENQTGVHMEYVVISPDALATNFATLLAADDLCDISCNARYYYPGTFRSAVETENYFVNIYDYRDYMPNYLYEATKDPEDIDTLRTIFTDDDLILNVYELKQTIVIADGPFVRCDWLAKLGLTQQDIITFNDLHDLLAAFKSQLNIATPMTLYRTLEVGGCNSWVGYDTYCNAPASSSAKLGNLMVKNGKVELANTTECDRKLMTMLNQWFTEGLIDPNWASYGGMQDIDARVDNDELGYVIGGGTTFATHDMRRGEKIWAPLTKPLAYEGQTLHLGFNSARVHWGSAAVAPPAPTWNWPVPGWTGATARPAASCTPTAYRA